MEVSGFAQAMPSAGGLNVPPSLLCFNQMQGRAQFWEGQPGLVWSNANAPDEVWIRAALLRPRFLQVLDIVEAFGIARVEGEWETLRVEGSPRARRVETRVDRILRNIRRGAALASCSD